MKQPVFFLTLALSLVYAGASAQVSVSQLWCEHQPTPLSVSVPQPQLSWQLTTSQRDTRQTAAEIRVAHSQEDLVRGRKLIWTSGKLPTAQSVGVLYAGPALQADQTYHWQVRVWDNHGNVSPWSTPARWHMAFLSPADWKATWIQPGYEESPARPSPLIRKEFKTSKPVRQAMLYITAHGLYEAHINGKRVGDACLAPGWTAYQARVPYQVYDVTDMITSSSNAIGVMLGSGWYRGYMGFQDKNDNYGSDISLLAQLEITYQDGTRTRVVTDTTWQVATGHIVSSEIYHGEIQDARLRQDGWAQPGYPAKGWSRARTAGFGYEKLVASENHPIRRHETFSPVRIFKTPAGDQVLDFGQNLVGWVQVKATGHAGDRIILDHAEVLDKAGNFYTDNLRAAKAADQFILSGGGEETFEPVFTFHGFRYVRVRGYPGELTPDRFTAVALYTDMRTTGSFVCSHPLINQLQRNILWGQKGNFLDVPTDCPQRDERLGWTGDAQVFASTAAFNMDVHTFFAKWLKDLAADQRADGAVPFVVPNILGPNAVASAGWADAATIIPWQIYQAYGDRELLAQQYPSMKAWVEYMHTQSRENLWNTGFHFGDWLFYRPQDDNDGMAAVTDKYLIAQCFYAYSTQLLIQAARVLDKTGDVTAYTALLEQIKSAFVREYMTPGGRLVSGTQTAYVLALHFDMLPEAQRQQAADRLAENVRRYNTHLTTGFLGTPYLCHVLSRFGHLDLAYELLMQESYPSWLYPVKMGATTIWERWDGQRPDSTFQTPGMNSFNHYAYGAIGDWMYRVIAGINLSPETPGYQHVVIRPQPGGGLTYAKATLDTYYGRITSYWELQEGRMRLQVEVPPNAHATICLPGAAAQTVSEGGRPLETVTGIHQGAPAAGAMILEAGSGMYQFEWNLTR